jgi:hypothetical protein
MTKLALAGPSLVAMNIPWPSHGASPSPIRLPLSEFVKNDRLLKALRKGVAAMQARKPSDPLSWFFQASIHGVTPQLVADALKMDSAVAAVNQQQYWNQCPHMGQSSANFLPWHRAYTHHFEEILRMHTEENDFAVPYWDYSPSNLDFPREFGIEHLDGDVNNDLPWNKNPLFYKLRDYFLCGYEYPFTNKLPLSQLSPRAVDASRAMSSPVFFGESESTGIGGGVCDSDPTTRGLLEQSPHDQIHRVVGGDVVGFDDNGNQVEVHGAMAQPPTAGFDPIFPVHHSNIDRLWAKWSCIPGKSWGSIPRIEWFHEAPWYFFDIKGNVINRPRMDYFDYRALGIRFKDEDPHAKPLPLPDSILKGGALTVAGNMVSTRMPAKVGRTSVTKLAARKNILAAPDKLIALALPPVEIGSAVKRPPQKNSIVANALAFTSPPITRLTITIQDIDLSKTHATGFDVYLVDDKANLHALAPDRPIYLGPISLFNHLMPGELLNQAFDATDAVRSLGRTSTQDLRLAVVPYALSTTPVPNKSTAKFLTGPMKAGQVSVSASSL